MNALTRLQEWFDSLCDGDWERDHKLEFGSLANPGWYASIPLDGTALERKAYQPERVERSEEDWYVCRIEDGVFKLDCGTLNLEEALARFLDWADRAS
jgi:hypothetical protein